MLDETTLVSSLKAMKTKELERHAEKLLSKMGACSYQNILATLIRVVPTLDPKADRFVEFKRKLVELEPFSDYSGEDRDKLVDRCAIILMLIITQKFQKIHQA